MNANSFLIDAALDLGVIKKEDSKGKFISYTIDMDNLTITNVATNKSVNITDKIFSRANFIFKLQQIRKIRNDLISQTDWVFLEDSNVSEEDKVKWKEYRNQLRDCTKTLVEGEEDKFVLPKNPFITYYS